MGAGSVGASSSYYGYRIDLNKIYYEDDHAKHSKYKSEEKYEKIAEFIQKKFQKYLFGVSMTKKNKITAYYTNFHVIHHEYMSLYSPEPIVSSLLWGHEIDFQEPKIMNPKENDDDVENYSINFTFPNESRTLLLDFLTFFYCKYRLGKKLEDLEEDAVKSTRSDLNKYLCFGFASSVYGGG